MRQQGVRHSTTGVFHPTAIIRPGYAQREYGMNLITTAHAYNSYTQGPGTDMLGGVFNLLFALVLILVILIIYFLPYSIARRRNHPNAGTIFWCNLLFGGTGWGWVICLVWATVQQVDERMRQQ